MGTRRCLKCGHEGPVSADPFAACPACGAIYAKMEQANAAQSAGNGRQKAGGRLGGGDMPSSAPQRRPRADITAGIVAIAFAAGFGLCTVMHESQETTKPRPTGQQPAPVQQRASYAVEYVVTGTARAVSLTYSNSTGGIEQHQDVRLPWRTSMQMTRGQVLSLIAQNAGDRGDIEVRIIADGLTLASSRADGAYAVASASESCCR